MSRALLLPTSFVAALVTGQLLVCASGHAEDSVALSGNYFKERSTRVYQPMVRLTKDLPLRSQLDVTYLVDGITSASAAFTATDEPFTELRNEIAVGVRTELFDPITVGFNARGSHEPDYDSVTVGADVALSLAGGATTLSAFFTFQNDEIYQRNQAGFRDDLTAAYLGVGYTQVVRKNLVAGVTAETSGLCGYQENPYRREVHPRKRRRWTLSGWARYRYTPSGTTARASYRFYTDNWSVVGHTADFEVFQALSEDIEIAPRVRLYSQSGAFFAQLATRSAADTVTGCETTRAGATPPDPTQQLRFSTEDPKLTTFGSGLYGLHISWRQSWLKDTPLGVFAESRVEPAYYFLDQGNRYDKAHIAQLSWFWPF